MKLIFAAVVLCLTALTALAVPPTLIFKNQQGEQTNARVLAGTFIGNQIAANSVMSNLTSSSAYPIANTYAAVSAKLTPAMLLTGLSASAGVVASTDTVLQAFNKVAGNQARGLQPGTVEAIIAAGALSTSIMESTVSNVTAGTYAVTLAPPSGQDGQVKIIKAVATMTHTVTLALTNVVFSGAYTPTGTTTMTFTNAGDNAIFIAVGSVWVYIGGSAVAS